jgi:hypothetical protein
MGRKPANHDHLAETDEYAHSSGIRKMNMRIHLPGRLRFAANAGFHH